MKLNDWINKKIDSFDQWAEENGVFAMLIVVLLSILFFGAIVILMP